MKELWRCFLAEVVKGKRAWHTLVAVMAPLCQLAFLGLLTWYSEDRVYFFRPGFYYWLELNCIAWNLVVMPLTAALVSQLCWELEDNQRMWALLLVQPVSRRVQLTARFLYILFMLLISQLLLQAFIIPAGLILRLNPFMHMGPVLFPLHFKFAAYSLLALFSAAAFNAVLAMRWPSLGVVLPCALIGAWGTVQLVGKSAFTQFLPFGLSAQTVILFERWRELPWMQAPGSLLSAFLWMCLGAWLFQRRKISR